MKDWNEVKEELDEKLGELKKVEDFPHFLMLKEAISIIFDSKLSEELNLEAKEYLQKEYGLIF